MLLAIIALCSWRRSGSPCGRSSGQYRRSCCRRRRRFSPQGLKRWLFGAIGGFLAPIVRVQQARNVVRQQRRRTVNLAGVTPCQRWSLS
ncbi:hypothetical protein LNQ03_03405 [Klebsiella pneumoniae subsp. pneumoniae]|nr:hypothetical protein [Klebsiella pneumoniae subsp. pneumoniae]